MNPPNNSVRNQDTGNLLTEQIGAPVAGKNHNCHNSLVLSPQPGYTLLLGPNFLTNISLKLASVVVLVTRPSMPKLIDQAFSGVNFRTATGPSILSTPINLFFCSKAFLPI